MKQIISATCLTQKISYDWCVFRFSMDLVCVQNNVTNRWLAGTAGPHGVKSITPNRSRGLNLKCNNFQESCKGPNRRGKNGNEVGRNFSDGQNRYHADRERGPPLELLRTPLHYTWWNWSKGACWQHIFFYISTSLSLNFAFIQQGNIAFKKKDLGPRKTHPFLSSA